MSKNIYVGNLSYGCTEDELRQLFEQYGQVSSAKIITDRDTGRSKGFGFVEMDVETEATAAIEALNGNDMGGRKIVVNEARPKKERR
jgi:RNA recognition motif-containing protein